MFKIFINTLSANPAKWSNTLEQFVGKLPTNFLSVFDHFVKLALKALTQAYHDSRKLLSFAPSKAVLQLNPQQGPGLQSLGFLVILRIFCEKYSIVLSGSFKTLHQFNDLAGIHHHPFYKHNFRQRSEAKIARYIRAVFLKYEIC